MSVTLKQQIPQATVDTMVAYLNDNVEPLLKEDVSNYAKGRKRAWFPYEAPLSERQSWKLGIQIPRLHQWLQVELGKLGFDPEVGIVTKGGGIKEHRDAGYADYRAFIVNLGECTLHYRPMYPDFKWAKPENCLDGQEVTYQLFGGEILEFNCKNPHWVTEVSPDRWGINCWSISAKQRAAFDGFRAGVAASA